MGRCSPENFAVDARGQHRVGNEMAVTIADRQFWLWRAVDDDGEVLDLLVQRRRDKVAAVKLMRKLLKKQGFAPEVLERAVLGSNRIGIPESARF